VVQNVSQFAIHPLFLRQFTTHKNPAMEQTRKYKALYWLIFLGSTAGLIIAIITHWEWLTLILPIQTTAFVKAMDIM
jgi:hypothetical protein